MIKNYFKIAFRSLMRHKGYSLVNIFGLALGIACFILISLWVFDELSYDRFHANRGRIFRVNTVTREHGIVTTSSWRLGPALIETYPEIETYTRLWQDRSLVKYEDKVFDEAGFYLADPDFFSMFTFPFTRGNPQTALMDKNAIVLTEAAAHRYFGDEEPIGKKLYVRRYNRDFKITGVIKNVPDNSSIRFDLMARVDIMPKQRLESWEFTGHTCVMLNHKADQGEVEEKIANFYREHVDSETDYRPVLQPLTQIHLNFEGKPGLIKQVFIFSIIAIFVLLLACVNFINLNTARAAERAKEVGVRKVVGASRKHLIQQFIGESIIIAFLALFLALFLIELSLPFFNGIVEKNLTLLSGQAIKTILFLFVLTLLSGITAGSYPAIYLASFQPVKIFGGAITASGSRDKLRMLLIIMQFTISIGLIAGALVVQNQLNYIRNKELGLKRDLVISLPSNPDLIDKYDAYKNEMMASGVIKNMSSAATNPLNVDNWININWDGNFDQESIYIQYTMVDYDFFKTFGMNIIKGRSFSKDILTDRTEACIINKTAANMMGLETPIGARAYFNHPAFSESFKRVRIIGVVDDFHFRSLHENIGPFIFRIYRPWHAFNYIKLKPGDLKQTIAVLEKVTKKFAPAYPFLFEFVDDSYNRIYMSEIRMGKIFHSFALLAIVISCLGLLGLISFTTNQRTKEIGIRKVLGASVPGIVLLLSRDNIQLVLFANFIAWPATWYAMDKWLQNFAYRIQLNWMIFIFAGTLALAIAMLTIIYQATKAAMVNPIESLRYE